MRRSPGIALRFIAFVALFCPIALAKPGGEPPSDSLGYYDNGEPGNFLRVGSLQNRSYPRWAVAFNQGNGVVDSLTAFVKGENGRSDAFYFRVRMDSAGRPGRILWTSSMVFIIADTGRWYSKTCEVPVNGRFYVEVYPYDVTRGHMYQFFDDNGDQAPSGTQWRYNGTAWIPDTQPGDIMIRCYVNIHNVGPTVIVSPRGILDSGSYVIPACSVRNYGDYTESYLVRLRIGQFYNDTASVWYQAPGDVQIISFPGVFLDIPPGVYPVVCSTCLTVDADRRNDRIFSSMTIPGPFRDVAVERIIAPSGAVIFGTEITPACSITNHGNLPASGYVTMKIGNNYAYRLSLNGLAPGASQCFTFPPWTPLRFTRYSVTCTTEVAGDMNPDNNHLRESFSVQPGNYAVVTPEHGFRITQFQIAPNPVTDRMVISYSLATGSNVNLQLYDITGRLVTRLAAGWHPAGDFSIPVARSGVPAGIYLLKLQAGDCTATAKVIVN